MPPFRPKLLVSVRNAQEARDAVQGGAEILDIKEPNAGSLGMAPIATIQAILNAVGETASRPIVSAALGETVEWESTSGWELPPGLTYLKLGTAGLGTDAAWCDRWIDVRRRIDRRLRDEDSAPEWVAVVYVDHRAASSPAPREILSAAVATGCKGVLFDTWSKSAGTLFDYLSVDELRALNLEIRGRGLFSAAAGRLSRETVPRAVETGADVIAVRSAACLRGDRQGVIDPQAIASLRELLRKPVESLERA